MMFIILFLFYFIIFISDCCEYYNSKYYLTDKGGNDIENWDSYCFQTPYRGGTQDPVYRETYQDMHYLVGYA